MAQPACFPSKIQEPFYETCIPPAPLTLSLMPTTRASLCGQMSADTAWGGVSGADLLRGMVSTKRTPGLMSLSETAAPSAGSLAAIANHFTGPVYRRSVTLTPPDREQVGRDVPRGEVHIRGLVGRRTGTRPYLVADPGSNVEVEQFRLPAHVLIGIRPRPVPWLRDA